MADARRSRWFAFDASFYDDHLGVMIRDRFGPVGLVLFSAFLAACKRSQTQGRFTYGSESDALAQMGIAGMELVNEQGKPFTLETFWRALGQHKQTTRRRRGHLTEITSTRWDKWQKNFARQQEAEHKPRSHGKKYTADTPPIRRRYVGDTPPDSDSDFDLDNDTSSSSAQPPSDAPAATDEEEDEERVKEAAQVVAKARLQRRESKLGKVDRPKSWLVTAELEALHELRAIAPTYPTADVGELVDVILGNDMPLRAVEPVPGYLSPFGASDAPEYQELEDGSVVRCS